MRTFLGVDGGGTKTDFLLIDESGQVVATRRGGSAYYLEIGIDALRTMLVQGILGTLQQAAVAPTEVSYGFIGLPAYGEDSRLLTGLDQMAAAALPANRYRCGNDVVCGWAGALGGCDGINIVAGTGSIAYGEYNSRTTRAGGWGELFSDEGSAYWIARAALNLFSRMSDGRAERTPLYELVREYFRVGADLDICAAVYGPPTLTRSELAALAPIVARAASAGDHQARDLFVTAADELAAIVQAARSSLSVPANETLPVSYSGGVFQLNNLLLPLFKAAVQKGGRPYEFATPQLSPVAGAALYAAKLAGTPLTPTAVARLTQTQGAPPG